MNVSYKVFVLFVPVVICAAIDSAANSKVTHSLVMRATESSNKEHSDWARAKRSVRSKYLPKITSMHVESNVSMRYASTLITADVINTLNKSKEVFFDIVLPENAFISGFIMIVNNREYVAYVKEKEEAKVIYKEAINMGLAAGHLETRDSNLFTVSVNLESKSTATFKVKYEELLVRKLDVYSVVININPRQLIDDMMVNVNIKEVNHILYLFVPEMNIGNSINDFEVFNENSNKYVKKYISADKYTASVKFSPNKEQQLELIKEFKKKSRVDNHINTDDGLSGQFIVQYNVEQESGGSILVNDGYFVHFFAPEYLRSLNKHAIFVLDTSGSMIGISIEQLKLAMVSILRELKPSDTFNIITFSNIEEVMHLEGTLKYLPTMANKNNIRKAENFINNLQTGGGTNMEAGLEAAFKFVESDGKTNSNNTEPLIIFLTDGDPNIGANEEELIKICQLLNVHRVPIFSLAFGQSANRDFLRKLSLKNHGFMRHIYSAADSSIQLKNFFKEISSPLLFNVKYEYPKDQIVESSMTRTEFKNYFNGSEMVIAGKTKQSPNKIDGEIHVSGYTDHGLMKFYPTIHSNLEGHTWPMERLWAYLSIKELLDQKEKVDNPKDVENKALSISLKYSFVTPLTSLVVVKPNRSSTLETIKETDLGVIYMSYSNARNIPSLSLMYVMFVISVFLKMCI